MKNRTVLTAATIALSVLLAPGLVSAQGRRAAPASRAPRAPGIDRSAIPKESVDTPLHRFTQMTPEEREKAIAKLPKDRQEKVREQLRRYDQLTPAQKAQVDWFNHLSPERQERFRKAFQRFQSEPADRQAAMREELQQLRGLSETERKSRLSGADFRSRFDSDERKILSEMAEVLAKR